ncbi:MAG: gliding motility-associated C-terminal domain-containing protein, partial [Bacteroidota bacterium]|nr:gliding motility-associated C-terminal domain-containing protein [Bacteroidota bacterium]
INVTNSGTYGVTVTNSNGCSASDQIQVQFNPLPSDVLNDITTCITQPPTLNAGNNGSTFLWSTQATTQSIVPSATGVYSVTITTAQNCAATFDAYVGLAPMLSVNLGNDTTICQGQQLMLNAGNPGATYEWSSLSTSQTLSVSNSGNFSVTASNGYCSASDLINVQVVGSPEDVLTDVTRCIGESVTLDAGDQGSEFLWNTDATTSSIEVTTPGMYSVLVTNANGCLGNFDAMVQFIAPPVVELGADTVLCAGDVLILDAGNTSGWYQWNTGAITRTISVGTPGLYTVSVDNGSCVRSDEINVLFNPAPDRILHGQVQFCMEEEPQYVLLNAGNEGSQYLWSTGAVSRTIEAVDYGTYEVLITNIFGCTRTDSIAVIEFCPSTIFAPNTFTPNNDGLNDHFIPIGNNIATMHLMIFDRWGTMIFQGDDLDVGWDGTYRGELVTDDIYVWRIKYRFLENKNGKLGMEQEMTGHIQVLR